MPGWFIAPRRRALNQLFPTIPMASGHTQVSAETIEKTKQQIRGLVGEIAQLSKSDHGARGVLLRVLAAGGAGAGGSRRGGLDAGRGKKAAALVSDQSQREAAGQGVGRSRQALSPARLHRRQQQRPAHSAAFGASDERMGGNPTRQLLVIIRWATTTRSKAS